MKTTGGKGLHVVAPIEPGPGWPACVAFARRVVDGLVAETPRAFTATMAKSARTGKIFIDYFRNQRGATSVAAYSTRARPGAPVSMPVTWEELDDVPAGSHFTIATAERRLAKLTGRSLGALRDGEPVSSGREARRDVGERPHASGRRPRDDMTPATCLSARARPAVLRIGRAFGLPESPSPRSGNEIAPVGARTSFGRRPDCVLSAAGIDRAGWEDSMARYSKGAGKAVKSAMRRRKKGTLRSGSGKRVTSRKQAIAIGLSEARDKGARVPRKSK